MSAASERGHAGFGEMAARHWGIPILVHRGGLSDRPSERTKPGADNPVQRLYQARYTLTWLSRGRGEGIVDAAFMDLALKCQVARTLQIMQSPTAVVVRRGERHDYF